MTGGDPYATPARHRTDIRPTIRRAWTLPGPHADGFQRRQRRHVAERAFKHALQHGGIDPAIALPVLARRTQQQLPGGPWLHVERDADVVVAVRAVGIAQFQYLVIEQ